MAYDTIQKINEEVIEKGKPFYIERNKKRSEGEEKETEEILDYMEHLEEQGIYRFNRNNGRYEPAENFPEYIRKGIESLKKEKKTLETLMVGGRENLNLRDHEMKRGMKIYADVMKSLGQKELLLELYENPQMFEEDKKKQ